MADVRGAPVAEEIYRLVGRSRRLLWMALAAELEGRGESIFIWQTVCYLARNGPTSQRDLAYANAQHPAGMSRLLDELESSGFVRRKKDRRDRRRLLVEVTPKGQAWLDAVTPSVMSGVDEAMRGLGSGERVALRGLLERLLGEDASGRGRAARLERRQRQPEKPNGPRPAKRKIQVSSSVRRKSRRVEERLS
ncbi:MAG TPA: MarR family transcriptional regulator [Polyangiaceae bacterium]|nr:MarR family transcriptional regulator [Polyangiaceae bacterium]